MKHLINGFLTICLIALPQLSLASMQKKLGKDEMHQMGAEYFVKSLKKLKAEGAPARGLKNYNGTVENFPFMKEVFERVQETKVKQGIENMKIVPGGNSTVVVKLDEKVYRYSKINFGEMSFELNGVQMDLLKFKGIKTLEETKKIKLKPDSGSMVDYLLPKAHAFLGMGDGAFGGMLLGGGLLGILAFSTGAPILPLALLGAAGGYFLGSTFDDSSEATADSTGRQ